MPVVSDTYRTNNGSENEIRSQEMRHTFMNRIISTVATQQTACVMGNNREMQLAGA